MIGWSGNQRNIPYLTWYCAMVLQLGILPIGTASYMVFVHCIIRKLKITDFTKKTNLKRTLSFEWRSSYREEHGHHRLPVRIRQSLVLIEASFLPRVKEHEGVVCTDPKDDEHCQHMEHAEKSTNVKCNTLTCRKIWDLKHAIHKRCDTPKNL